MNKTKICRHCQSELPIEAFVKSRKSKDGYSNLCKECKREIGKEEYRRNYATYINRLTKKREEPEPETRKCLRCRKETTGKFYRFYRNDLNGNHSIYLCSKCYKKLFSKNS